jgi:hypothetical protein
MSRGAGYKALMHVSHDSQTLKLRLGNCRCNQTSSVTSLSDYWRAVNEFSDFKRAL